MLMSKCGAISGQIPPIPTAIMDSFNRADNATSLGDTDTGQTWSVVAGTWGIISNTAYTSVGAADAIAIIESNISNCSVEVVLSTIRSTQGMVFRYTDANNYYTLETLSGGTYRLIKRESGSLSVLQTYLTTFADGQKIKIVVNGTSIKAYLNDTEIMSQTNSFNQTATKHGMYIYNNPAGKFNDFKIEAV